MTGFLDLSREIRDMIYELCLVTDKVIIPFPEYYPLDRVEDLGFRDDMPTVALLGVSKLIGDEAAEILYGKNTWRLTSKAPQLVNANNTYGLWTRRTHLIRHIVLVLDQRDVDPKELQEKTEIEHLELQDPTERPHAQRKRLQCFLHQIANDIMIDMWERKLEIMSKLSNLETAKFDVRRLYCWFGCCRIDMLRALMWRLKWAEGDRERSPGSQNPEFYLQGILNEKEEEILQQDGFSRDPESKIRGLGLADYVETKYYLNY